MQFINDRGSGRGDRGVAALQVFVPINARKRIGEFSSYRSAGPLTGYGRMSIFPAEGKHYEKSISFLLWVDGPIAVGRVGACTGDFFSVCQRARKPERAGVQS